MKERKYTRLLILIMLIALVISLLSAEVMNNLVSTAEISKAINSEQWRWLRWLGEITSLAWVSLLIGIGAYHSLSGKMRFIAIPSAAIGLLFVVGGCLHQLSQYRGTLETLQFMQHPPQLRQIEPNNPVNNNDALVKMRSDLAKGDARYVFLTSGRIQSYPDADGAVKQYAPTKEEIAERDQVLETLVTLPKVAAWQLFRVWLYSIAAVVSLLCAVVCYFINKRTKNDSALRQLSGIA